MKTHPFKPLITSKTKKLLIGTLPPEGVDFYFSNSPNTRLWDILQAIKNKTTFVSKGGNSLSPDEKKNIVDALGVGIADIIFQYQRDNLNSTKDKHIDPKRYNDLLQIAVDNNIDTLLFVYKSAFKWFIHSLQNVPPVRLHQLKTIYTTGKQADINIKSKIIKCILLPSPLSRGQKGETLAYKLEIYRQFFID